jgi:hypothetical protein
MNSQLRSGSKRLTQWPAEIVFFLILVGLLIIMLSVVLAALGMAQRTAAESDGGRAGADLTGGDLTGSVVFDTREYTADGEVRTLVFTNTLGTPLRIRKAYLWMGMYHGALGDGDATVLRTRDGAIVAKLQWDHYAEPSAPVAQVFDFAPDYVQLDAGETLTLVYYTHPLDSAGPFKAAVQCIVWWSTYE